MRPLSLKVKLGLYLFGALSVAMVLFTVMLLRQQQEDMQRLASRHVTEISDLIVASTRYAMLVNQRDMTEQIIGDIGRQKGIERVRVLNKTGTVSHSSRPAEVGRAVNQKDEPCVHCHLSNEVLTKIPEEKRWKILAAPDGHRVLVAMHVIRNELTCSTASCHEHSPSQSVLGIVDIAYSLDDIDQTTREHAIRIIGVSVGFILLLSLSAGLMLKRLIYVPLKDMESGANKIASGNLDHAIPVRHDDEFGHVAVSFNEMTTALKDSRQQMQELVQTLETKVAERTRDLLAAKAEVAQGEKLASIGVLASGVAHELNNPLTGVLTFASLLRKKASDGTEDAEDLDLVIRETKRCASIIRRLLDFAREKVPVKGYFDLNQVIAETIRFVERPVSLQQIEIKTALAPGLPNVWGDADLIKQVVLNLLVNAQQAIDGSGSIFVQSRSAAAGAQNPSIVEVSVRDTGCGIPQANLERIFDPFFTSKEVGKGTGLGLSVSYGIVKAHGGRITVESVVGEGTTFNLYLPVAPPIDESASNSTGNTHEH